MFLSIAPAPSAFHIRVCTNLLCYYASNSEFHALNPKIFAQPCINVYMKRIYSGVYNDGENLKPRVRLSSKENVGKLPAFPVVRFAVVEWACPLASTCSTSAENGGNFHAKVPAHASEELVERRKGDTH